MNKKVVYFTVIIVTLLLIAMSCRFIIPIMFPDKELNGNSIHRIYISYMEDGHIYFPTIVDDKNNTIINASHYYFKTGEGTIESVTIEDIEYLNISSRSDNIVIESERINILDGKILRVCRIITSKNLICRKAYLLT